MARGNPIVPIVHARRGSGRRTEGQYLRPTLSGHLAGHAARAPVPVGSGPESNGPADPLGTNCPGLAVADEVPSAIGGGPPQRAWTAGAHDPGGPTLAASPRRGALQAQQRATRVRVTPWRRLICRTRRTGRARPRRCCRGGRTAAWCGAPRSDRLATVGRQGPDDAGVQRDDQQGPERVVGDEPEVGDHAQGGQDDTDDACPRLALQHREPGNDL